MARLSVVSQTPRDGQDLDLNLNLLDVSDDLGFMWFVVDNVRYEYDLLTRQLVSHGKWTNEDVQAEHYRLENERSLRRGGAGVAVIDPNGRPEFRSFSPDGEAFVFAREHNVFLFENEEGDPIQLSTHCEANQSFNAPPVTMTHLGSWQSR